MTAITVTGINSVIDRTIFTDFGPIVKPTEVLDSGSNLIIKSQTEVQIPSLVFGQDAVGRVIVISGSPNGRNDGTFFISNANESILTLENASFDLGDFDATLINLIDLANALKITVNSHLSLLGIHNNIDSSNIITAEDAVDITSAEILLNQIKQKLSLHVVATPSVHVESDVGNVEQNKDASQLASSLILANSLRLHYESHRQNVLAHLKPDNVDRLSMPPVIQLTGGSITGPFSWQYVNPHLGEIADSPFDVSVTVNASPASVDAVFGLLGAVVLSVKPTHGDNVDINYEYAENPPVQFKRLNSQEFNLNQYGNLGLSGIDGHQYEAQASLLMQDQSDMISPVEPQRTGWKYKGYEREYTSGLNDPTNLLLNIPTTRIAFSPLVTTVYESVIRYDPTSLPQNATDPWILEGDRAGLSLVAGGSELIINDSSSDLGNASAPPFFSHNIDLSFPSVTNAAFRAKVDLYTLDGSFTGVGFGISDGARAAFFGFLQTDATGLSSAMVLANSLKANFNTHLSLIGVHSPNDTQDVIQIVDAKDLASLIFLSNTIQTFYNVHLAKGSGNVHIVADAINPSTSPVANDLASCLVILNEIRSKFNTHLTQSGIHFNNDTSDSVSQIKQIGILTNSGYPELQDSWDLYASNWTEYSSYRIFRDSTGNVSLFLSGGLSPIISTDAVDLPSLSSFDGKFDSLQQVFFGSISHAASSVSRWQFIRVDINPLDSNQVTANKSVVYSPTVIPELDPTAPWITVGQGGIERISSGSLLLDSTCSATPDEVLDLGLSTGAYRGFLRLEPVLTPSSSASFEFSCSVGYYTYSVNNLASGVFIDDGNLVAQLAFLQAFPLPSIIVGRTPEPFVMSPNQTIVISVNSSSEQTVVLPGGLLSAAALVASITPQISGLDLTVSTVSGSIQFQTTTTGETSEIKLIGGTALPKLGFLPGTYFGSDSSPEPKLSWFGETKPDLDNPTWQVSGTQSSTMFGRTLRIIDDSASDHLTYTISDPRVTNQVFNSSVDWKIDARLQVQSFTAGGTISGLQFCGVLINVDEGPSGKNVELQLATDSGGTQYIHILSYDGSMNTLTSISQIPFSWDDFKIHSYNLFTSKNSNSILVNVDGIFVGSFNYSSLLSGGFGPAITFGSGSAAVSNVDLNLASSVVDWQSVCIFRDTRISDPSSASNRYIGLYKGGDPTLLNSYSTFQMDWTPNHTYRIVKDSSIGINVYVDGAQAPVISVDYTSLNLPLSSNGFFSSITQGKPCLGFGSFNPYEIDRTKWGQIRYSIGKITQSNNIVPSYEVLNRANVVSSPEHLFTNAPHQHFGTRVYSGGTPTDEFLSDISIPAYTNLGENTPPMEMSQNLESLGGLYKTIVPAESVASDQLISQSGFLTDFENDSFNVVTASNASSVPTAILLVNNIQAVYNKHLSQYRVHVQNDTADLSVENAATDQPSAILLANELRSKYEAHRIGTSIQGPYHINADTVNVISAPIATDPGTLINLVNDLSAKYTSHLTQINVHAGTVFLSMNCPEAAIYQGMKFFTHTVGTAGLVSTFTDEVR